MKILKTLVCITLLVTLFACSKKDDDGGTSAEEASYTATINGGGFTNFSSTLGSYAPDFNSNGLTLAIVDQNSNTIRIFLNKTGGFTSGVVKTIGNEDADGFITSVIIRNDANQQIFGSSEGNITITSNIEDSDNEQNLISGTINVTANNNTGTVVTISGTFTNFQY